MAIPDKEEEAPVDDSAGETLRSWRRLRLERIGFRGALLDLLSDGCDVELAERLIATGCDRDTAARILI